MIAARGYGAREVERQIALAVELSAHIGAGDRIVPALFLNWIARFNETDVRFEVARQIAQVAAAGSTLDKLMAHRCMGTTLLFRGEFLAAIAEFEQFQKLFDPELHNEALNRIGATIHAVTVKVGLAEAWTVLGNAEQAGSWRKAALDDAEASGHYQTICHTAAFAGGLLAAFMEDADDLAFHATRLRNLTFQHDPPYWRPHADLLGGVAEIRHGAIERDPPGSARHRADDRQRLPSLTAWCVVAAGGCVKPRPRKGLRRWPASRVKSRQANAGPRASFTACAACCGCKPATIRAASTTLPRRSGLPGSRVRGWSRVVFPRISRGWRKRADAPARSIQFKGSGSSVRRWLAGRLEQLRPPHPLAMGGVEPAPTMNAAPTTVQTSGSSPNTRKPRMLTQNELGVGERREHRGVGIAERQHHDPLARGREHADQDAEARSPCQLGVTQTNGTSAVRIATPAIDE